MACLATAPAFAQICGPLDDGRVADVFYQGTAVFFDPVVEYEWDRAVLTISGPCEDIVRSFKRGEEISFDVREIERVTDGQYSWQLRFEPTIDSGVQEDLLASRGTGEEDAVWWHYWQKGAIPGGPSVESASFTVFRGSIIDPDSGEEKSASLGAKGRTASVAAAAAAGIDGGGASASGEGDGHALGAKDQVIPDDLIVQGSACVGFDCVNGESFGFDTIRMKENNTRIQFNDTSSTASFPTNNWQIRANSSANGGGNFLAFVDQNNSDTSETGTLVFVVEADAGANALFVDSTGRVGLGTGTPVLDLHISSTNTPGLRLEQTSGGGFTAQTWDIAGNEANFFVRDVTGGSRLPLRIRPDAPSSSIDISSDGDVGIGTASPDAGVDIERAGGGSAVSMLRFTNTNGPSRLEFRDTTGAVDWDFRTTSGDTFVITQPTSPTNDFQIASNGNVTVRGTLTTSGPTCGAGCDRVFAPDFELESIEDHAASMWANSYLPAVGPTRPGEAFNVSEKTGGILNELEKAHIYIEQLNEKLKKRDALIEQLALRLGQVEESVQPAAVPVID